MPESNRNIISTNDNMTTDIYNTIKNKINSLSLKISNNFLVGAIYSFFSPKILYYSAISTILFFSIIYFLTQTSFFFGISVNIFFCIASIILTIIILYTSRFYERKLNSIHPEPIKKRFVFIFKIALTCVVVFIVSILIGQLFIDEGNDSNVYHKPYSYYFSHGWNPTLSILPQNLGEIPFLDVKHNTYPKAIELIASYIYLLTNSIETVKSVNIILFFATFIIGVAAFSIFFPENFLLSTILAFLAACNPIWITQASQFYNDGCVSQLFSISIFLILLIIKKTNNILEIITFIGDIVLLFNTKGSSLLFVPIIVTLFIMLFYFIKNRNKVFLISIITIILLLTGITGYSPYFVNYIKYNSPLGDEFSDSLQSPDQYMIGNVGFSDHRFPSWFVPKELFFLSLFTYPSQKFSGLTNPLDISLDSLYEMSGENRINGFGPMLGLITILTILSIILGLWNFKNHNVKIIYTIMGFIFLSVILHPECWWARFVPQLFLIPVFSASIGWMCDKKPQKIVAIILILCLIANMLLVGSISYMRSEFLTEQFESAISEIKSDALFPIIVKNSINQSSETLETPIPLLLLNEREIPWKKWTKDINIKMYEMKYYIYFYANVFCNQKDKLSSYSS